MQDKTKQQIENERIERFELNTKFVVTELEMRRLRESLPEELKGDFDKPQAQFYEFNCKMADDYREKYNS